MPRITEGKLTFDFPRTWQAAKFDEWSFYTHQFQRISDARMPCAKEHCDGELRCSRCNRRRVAGNRGVDIVAIGPGGSCLWTIEVKDYREHRRTKTINLADEVALKVRDSLSAMVAAHANANDNAEREMAKAALECSQLRVVLHLEQPAKTSKLFPRAIDPADVTQRLRQLIKAVDPHPLVVETGDMKNVAWSVANANARP